MVERLNVLDDSGARSQKTDADFLKEMTRLFGEDADQRALIIRGGIILQEQKLPPLIKIKPSDFQLLPTCKAASWSELKQPIGADPAALQRMIQGSGQSSGQGPAKPGRNKRSF